MQGLANGISNGIAGVIGKAKAAAAQVTNTVKGAFGIHSLPVFLHSWGHTTCKVWRTGFKQ
jgi:hypothetical protein